MFSGNGISTPKYPDGGHHKSPCCYLENLRQSLEYLERITAVSPASSGCSVGFGRSAFSRQSDTLGYNSQSPDCLVVYEPHVPSDAGHSRGRAYVRGGRRRYRSYKSSSSESSSSSDGKLGDSFTTLEDSGVDLEPRAGDDDVYSRQMAPDREEYQTTKHKSGHLDKSTHTSVAEMSGVCFCAVGPRTKQPPCPTSSNKNYTDTNHSYSVRINTPNLVESEGNDLTAKLQNENHRTTPSYEFHSHTPTNDTTNVIHHTPNPGNSEKSMYETDRNSRCYMNRDIFAADDNEWFVDDTPTPTPTPSESDHRVSQTNHSCQTESSVFRKKVKDSGKQQTNQTWYNMRGRPGYDKQSFDRRSSVQSVQSDTDTVSVTSLEVAHIMTNHKSADDNQLEINNNEIAKMLEEDRVKLHHQRLQSYQKICGTDSPKILPVQNKSTFIPVQVAGKAVGQPKQRSIQNFVAQSLQSFFTGTSCEPKSDSPVKTHPHKTQMSLIEQSSNTSPGSRKITPEYLTDFYPSLYQLIAAFQLVKVTLRNTMNLQVSQVVIDKAIFNTDLEITNDSSSPGSTRVPGSGGAFRSTINRETSPAAKCTMLVIRGLTGFEAKISAAKVSVGDVLIEVRVGCLFSL